MKPVGLKNVEATYQRLLNKIFKEKFGKTMEVYIDGMLMKSLKAKDHIEHLRQKFEILNKYQIILNSEKCTGKVSTGMFLWYMVIQIRIEANPRQIRTQMEMPSPRNKKDVQWPNEG